jgi:hypothetical protein
MADVLPEFILFFKLLFDIIQRLAGMSRGFLQVANVILATVDSLIYIITIGGWLEEQIGALIAAMLTAATVMLLWNSAILSGLVVSLQRIGFAVINRVIPSLALYIKSMGFATATTMALTAAIATLIGVVTLGLGAVAIGAISSMANKFGLLGSNISDATSKLRDFKRLSRGAGGDNPYGFGGSGDVSRGSTGSTALTNFEINVQGDANPDTLQNQTKNANFRADRTNSTT